MRTMVPWLADRPAAGAAPAALARCRPAPGDAAAVTRLVWIAFALLVAAPARAQFETQLEFAGSALPSVSHGASFVAGSEAALASVAGGVLSFSTLGPATQGFWILDAPALDLRGDLHVEWRLRVDGMEGTSHGGFGVLVGDGVRECNVLFRPDGVAVGVVNGVFGTGSFFAFDHSAFHVYELSSAGGSSSCALAIDGVARTTAERPPEATLEDAAVAFGDFVNEVSDAGVTLDYLRVTVPEPAGDAGALAALAALALAAARRA